MHSNYCFTSLLAGSCCAVLAQSWVCDVNKDEVKIKSEHEAALFEKRCELVDQALADEPFGMTARQLACKCRLSIRTIADALIAIGAVYDGHRFHIDMNRKRVVNYF